MSTVLTVAVLATAIGAGVRSTWSPCGLSMLSTVTPLAERARGHRFATTATWFVAGAAGGGVVLGGATATLAGVVAWIGVNGIDRGVLTAALGTGAALLAAGSDSRLVPLALPIHRRQVNERWLDGLRPWVYGAGFGAQIGVGLATYIVTAGVYLLVALGALSGRPLLALSGGVVFGLTRGLAVLLGAAVTSPERLLDFHRRFHSGADRVRQLTLGVEVVVAGASAATAVLAATSAGAGADTAVAGATALVCAGALGLAGTQLVGAATRRETTPRETTPRRSDAVVPLVR